MNAKFIREVCLCVLSANDVHLPIYAVWYPVNNIAIEFLKTDLLITGIGVKPSINNLKLTTTGKNLHYITAV